MRTHWARWKTCLPRAGVQGVAEATTAHAAKAMKKAALIFCFMPGRFEIVACVFPWLLVCVPSFLFFSVLLFFSSCCAICFCFVFYVAPLTLCLILQPQATKKKKAEKGQKGVGV